jgi:hypothetical protein
MTDHYIHAIVFVALTCASLRANLASGSASCDDAGTTCYDASLTAGITALADTAIQDQDFAGQSAVDLLATEHLPNTCEGKPIPLSTQFFQCDGDSSVSSAEIDSCNSWWWGADLIAYAGVHNFLSPVNNDSSSNFGFHEGMNWGVPLWRSLGLGSQIGFVSTQGSFLDASTPQKDFHTQWFITTGLFHRPIRPVGFQYGLVFDWQHDNFADVIDVGQLRGEFGWLWNSHNEVGYWFTAGVRPDHVVPQLGAPTIDYEAINQNQFFYRRRFIRGGESRIWGGFSGTSAGLLGGDYRVPVSDHWAVEGGFNYLITQNSRTDDGQAWNLGVSMVWYIGGNATRWDPHLPLLHVAGNGAFIVTRK